MFFVTARTAPSDRASPRQIELLLRASPRTRLALLAKARVFVHPSVEEGMGSAVVEAMLARVPVVVSDAGGLPEVVGDAGTVVPREDPAALSAAIRRVLAGEHPCVAAAAERALQRFGVDRMVEGTMAVYQGLA